MTRAVNPILLEVFKNRFASIAEEMGVALMRTGFSPNIKERRDFSCALFTGAGDMLAQAAHIPVHLGSMPLSVKAAIQAVDLRPGDMAMLNNPFQGGTHLPDITLVAPVFAHKDDPKPAFLVANRAHHADLGGMAPGSMPLSNSLFQEGVIIPPLKLVRAGEIDRPLLDLLLANVRTPQEREGDFAAQIMANTTGVKRTLECLESHGPKDTAWYAEKLLDYVETLTRETIARIPDGVYEFADLLDDDGQGRTNIPIHLVLTIDNDTARLDFSRSAPQTRGCVNSVRAIALSAALYAFRCLIDKDIPANQGCLRPIEIITQPGTIVDARFPAAVAGGNVETSQRIVDVILGALALALKNTDMEHKRAAASQGTMNNVSIGGFDPRKNRPFAYYETIAGGMGATPAGPGESGVHSHMTNTLNTPVEALEYAYPFLVTRYALRKQSGGQGEHPGGDGLVREMLFLSEAEATVLSERRLSQPYGLDKGQPGQSGQNTLIKNNVPTPMPPKFHLRLAKGDRLRIETPGGGGYSKD